MSAVSIRRCTAIAAAAVVLLIVWLLVEDFGAITSRDLGTDASQNVLSSINLVRHGVYSMQPISPDVVPGFRREPFPNFLLAFYLKMANVLSPGLLDQVRQPFSDGFLVLVKQINLVWVAGLFLGLWLTSALVFAPMLAAHVLAFVQILMVNHFFVVKTIDGMNTELIAGMVMVWLGAVLLMALRGSSWRWLLIAGVVFGMLALTKATGAYVALVVCPAVALAMSGLSKRFWVSLLAISFGFMLAVMPWLVRNHVLFSRPVIAQGGGDVLLIRSSFNQMNRRQFIDAFYAYAPKPVRRDLLGAWMGLSDEDFSCDGRLSVFNRRLGCDQLALKEGRYDDVRSFYQRGKKAIPAALSLARDQGKALAISSFRQQPLNAFATTLPIGWRGFWGFSPSSWPGIVLNVLSYTALLLAPLFAVVEQRLSWLMVSIVPVSFFVFYGLLSHFLPRYSSPLVPASLVCIAMLVVDLIVRLVSRLWPASVSPVRLR